MAEARAEEEAAAAKPSPGRSPRRTRVGVLLAFLGAFLLLIVVFRSVLFPFLMAIFIAYLIEPVVAAFTKAPVFGVRWTRGPTIVLMYVVLLGGIVLLTSCTVATITQSVKEVSADVSETLHQTSQRARFHLAPASATPEEDADEEGGPGGPEADRPPPPEPLAKDVFIPARTRIVLRPRAAETTGRPARGTEPAPPAAFLTLYDVVFPAGALEATVLLREDRAARVSEADVGRILDPAGLQYADGTPFDQASRLLVSAAEPAEGLEVLMEERLITPIVENLERKGIEVDPSDFRALVSAQAAALGENLPEKVTRFTRNFIGSLALSIYEFVLILMLTAFIVMDRRAISSFFASLPPEEHRDEYHTLIRYVDRGLAGVVRGQLVICLVNGVLTYVGLKIFAIKAAEILALIAGILSLIPIFGTIVSSIPIVLFAATDGIDKGVYALGWIVFIHLLEANLLNPLIMGTHARMHPVVIVFALLAGEHSFGVWGALLAVPTASIIQSCFLFYRHEIEGVPWEPPPKAHGQWLRKILGKPFRRRSAARVEATP